MYPKEFCTKCKKNIYIYQLKHVKNFFVVLPKRKKKVVDDIGINCMLQYECMIRS